MGTLTFADLTGSKKRADDTTHVVCFYYTPSGRGSTDPIFTTVYYSDEALAQAFVDKWCDDPVNAELMTLTDYDASSDSMIRYTGGQQNNENRRPRSHLRALGNREDEFPNRDLRKA